MSFDKKIQENLILIIIENKIRIEHCEKRFY